MHSSKERHNSLFGYTHPDKPLEEMCPYCYNEDTQKIIDEEELAPYKKHHGDDDFKAFSCFCCGGEFHFKSSN